jgi:hypothetical protein
MKTHSCTCGCTETATIVVPFLTGFDAESADIDFADREVCVNCGSTVQTVSDPSIDDDDELPF